MREIQDFEQENDHLQLTLPTGLTEQNEKGHVPDDPDSDPSMSELSSKKKKCDKNKKCQKYRKDASSDSPLSNNYDSSDGSDYKLKQRKSNSH